MKVVYGLLFLVIIFGMISIQSVDASTNGKLTIKPDSKTIKSIESTFFTGKLSDSEGYAISSASVVLWENENGVWTYVAQGKTDLRGKYKITVDANFWDYGKSVNIVAYSKRHLIQSPFISINIEKPYAYEIKPKVNNSIQSSNIISNSKSNISITNLRIADVFGNTFNHVKVNQDVVIVAHVINNNNFSQDFAIQIIVKGTKYNTWITGSLSPNQEFSPSMEWTPTDSGTYTINTNVFDNIKNKNKLTKSINTNIIVDAIIPSQSTSTQISDSQYKDPTYKIKSKYYDILKELESGVKLTEKTLSGISFENSDAKSKIDSSWKIRYMIWGYIDEGKDILKQTESYLKDKNYQKAWEKLDQLDTQIFKVHNHITAISTKLAEGKELEDKYQEKNKTCFFGWCNAKDTTKGLDVKIKDLELKVEKIKNNQKDITFQYKTENQNQNLAIQKNEYVPVDVITFENTLEKSNLETKQEKSEVRNQDELVDTENQQKLEEQRLQEQRDYEDQLYQQEQRRLQEQRDYEDQLYQQQIQAEQERQRLEVQKQKEIQEQKRQAEEQRQRLEREQQIENEKSQIIIQSQKYPLIKGWMNGGLTFYVPAMPNDISQSVKNSVERLASFMDGNYFNGIKLKRVYSGYADITVQWAKDWQGDKVGKWLGNNVVVGLGQTSCDGKWKPFDGTTVYRLMYHEMGHALGQNHNSNPDNIMYKLMKNAKYEYEYDESITLIDGSVEGFYICSDGTYSFVTEKTGTSNGYKTFLIPPNTNALDVINGKAEFYLDCSSYKNEMKSTSSQCYAPSGSTFLLYNPSVFGKGSDIPIDVKIINISPAGNVNYSFDKNDRQFSDDYLGRIRLLFDS